MVNATHCCDKTVYLKWRPKYSTKSSSSSVNLEISMSSASCETELAEWKGGGARKDSNQVVHSRYCFSLTSKSGFYSSFKHLLALKYNCNSLFKTSPAGFPANLRQHTGAWVLQRFLSFFINFYFLELSCETFTLGEVSCFLL